MTPHTKPLISTTILIILLTAATACGPGNIFQQASLLNSPTPTQAPQEFDGERALNDIEQQLSFGPRIPGSQGHAKVIEYISLELEQAGWTVEVQNAEWMGIDIKNIISRRESKENEAGDPAREWLILGAHYDTRMFADNDPDPGNHREPVPGANDGASGVAVLLELARVLPPDMPMELWLVFFDAEDNGRIPGWDWILGSRAFVSGLDGMPDGAVIVDMIGDADLNLYFERSSDQALSQAIWNKAAELGYEQFIPSIRHHIIDDHTPFLEAGIPAIDIIDFDYPYWHTTEDTLDKVSAESLGAVGRTLQEWLKDRAGANN